MYKKIFWMLVATISMMVAIFSTSVLVIENGKKQVLKEEVDSLKKVPTYDSYSRERQTLRTIKTLEWYVEQ